MKNTSALNFEGQVVFAGIDVHKRSWTVSIRMNDMALRTFSMEPSPEKLGKLLRRDYPGAEYKSAYEAGFCGFHIHERLTSLGIDNIVVNPADVPTTHKEKTTKTDRVDSRKLAKSLEHGQLTGIYVPDGMALQLRQLCRGREREVSRRTQLQNRIKGQLTFLGIPVPPDNELKHWSGGFIKHLEDVCSNRGLPGLDAIKFNLDALKDVRQRVLSMTLSLRGYLKAHPDWEPVLKNMMTIPGIGFITAATLYTEIVDINRFRTLEQLASYVGLVPSCHSSGEHESSGHVTVRQNKRLRHLLIEASWIAVRNDPALTMSFNKSCKIMKKQRAIVKTARNLLNRVRFVWRNRTAYKCFVTN